MEVLTDMSKRLNDASVCLGLQQTAPGSVGNAVGALMAQF